MTDYESNTQHGPIWIYLIPLVAVIEKENRSLYKFAEKSEIKNKGVFFLRELVT